MFDDRKKKKLRATFENQNMISQGTSIVGDLSGKGDFRIDGTITGTITTSGKVIIGEKGIVNGTLKSTNTEIQGTFSGKLLTNILSLKSTAQVGGEVEVSKLAVEPGAVFNAGCVMKGTVKEFNKNKNLHGKDQSA